MNTFLIKVRDGVFINLLNVTMVRQLTKDEQVEGNLSNVNKAGSVEVSFSSGPPLCLAANMPEGAKLLKYLTGIADTLPELHVDKPAASDDDDAEQFRSRFNITPPVRAQAGP